MSQQFGYEEQVGNFEPGISASRAEFIGKTYSHVFGAMCLFTVLEIGFFVSGLAAAVSPTMVGSGMTWLAVLGAFMIVGWLATRVAHSAESKPLQYMALIGFVFAESLIFMPMLWMCNEFYAPGLVTSAATVTLAGFGGLTAIAFFTRKDFSFLGGIIKWGFLCALLAIVASLIFGFNMGTWFSVAMVGLAGAAILYDTSNIIRHYPEDRYVGAALQLFASVAVMFWYVLRIFMSRD
jgi:hypothetical protein